VRSWCWLARDLMLSTERYGWSYIEGAVPARLQLTRRAFILPTMTLKNAALLALIGTILLTVLVLAHFISTVLGVMRGLIPAMALLTSLIHLFASLSVMVFFYVFYRTQS
jgi:hypothetical protein